MRPRRSGRNALVWCAAIVAGALVGAGAAGAEPASPAPTSPAPTFATGVLGTGAVGSPGCGKNTAGEPSVHVSKDNLVEVASEDGIGHGTEVWRANVGGGPAADACALTYSGKPDAVGPAAPGGGDVDTAIAPDKDPATGHYRIYVASLYLGSVSVATSADDGKTFALTPVQAGVPLDDRQWIAAYGDRTSLLSYHDVATTNIDILRSDNSGATYTEISQAIPATDYKAMNNQLGNLVIDHDNAGPVAGGFWAYQAFVAPSTPPALPVAPPAEPGGDEQAVVNDEAFLAVSADGGHTWTDKPIPCSTSFGGKGLNHQFPNVSVAPDGTLHYAVANGTAIYTATSADHGDHWTCSAPVSTTKQAVFPWLVATSAGEDLVYYGTDGTGPDAIWSVYFAQHTPGATTWATTQVVEVHRGEVCEEGATCTDSRQLADDFGVDTDQSGYAHIAYSADAPGLGGKGNLTGYAVQRSGTPMGRPN